MSMSLSEQKLETATEILTPEQEAKRARNRANNEAKKARKKFAIEREDTWGVMNKYLGLAFDAMKEAPKGKAGAAAEKVAKEMDLSLLKKHPEVLKRAERENKSEERHVSTATKFRAAYGEIKDYVFGGMIAVTGMTLTTVIGPEAALMVTNELQRSYFDVGFRLASGETKYTENMAISQRKKDEYTRIKQTQLALKKLKKVLLKDGKPSYKDEVNKLFAAGYGNPGGVITHFAVKKDGGR